MQQKEIIKAVKQYAKNKRKDEYNLALINANLKAKLPIALLEYGSNANAFNAMQ